MSDFFISRDKDLTKEQTLTKINPVLFSDPDPEIYFLFSESVSKFILNKLKIYIRKVLPEGKRICFLYTLRYVPEEKEIKKNMSEFFFKNTIDLSKYIPPNSKVIPIGRALYSITFDTTFSVDTFFDLKWNKSYFYTPFLKSYVFPVDFLSKWFNIYGKNPFPKDNFEKFFTTRQIQRIGEFEAPFRREVRLKKVIIDEPNLFLKQNFGKGTWSYDIETDSLDWTKANIGDLTLSNDGITGYYLRWKDIDIEVLNEFFRDKYLIAANGSYDAKILRRLGVFNATVHYDTVHAGHCLNEDRSNRLKTHAWVYTKHGGYDLDLERYKDKYKVTNYLRIPEKIRIPYGIMDAIVTFQVYLATKKELAKEPELERFFYEVRMPTVQTFIDVGMRGFYINWDEVRLVGEELKEKIKNVKDVIFQYFGYDVDLNSGPKLGKFIEHKLGWPCLERTKKSIGAYYKVNKSTLKEWEKLGYKAATYLLEYNSLTTVYDTFIGDEKLNTGMWQYRKSDNKIYPGFGVMMARSLRFLCSNPNGQNWPSKGEIAKLVKRIFSVPSKDYYLVEWDAAGLQLRIVAAQSGDANMRKAFVEMGGDLHSLTAQKLFANHISLEEFIKGKSKNSDLKDKRDTSKAVNFSIVFNTTARSFGLGTLKSEWKLSDCDAFIENKKIEDRLASTIEYNNSDRAKFPLSEDDSKYVVCADRIIQEFFQLYPDVKKWISNSIEKGKKDGYLRSPFGNRRLVSKLIYEGKDSDFREIKNLMNICCNSPVQSHEVGLMCRTMNKLHEYIKNNQYSSHIIGTIHDSAVMYIHKNEFEDLCRRILEFFAIDYPENNGIPMEAEIKVADVANGEVWGFSKLEINSENIDEVFCEAS